MQLSEIIFSGRHVWEVVNCPGLCIYIEGLL
jgi:hypothetical protein